ncbi:acetyl-CoA acetyltransferase [Sphingobium sp. HWE2-09]|uniref:acetyl-CoA acetyltransferase n=1 Tax=Sphingobium sp. HWE2-09 TaxID=3108390 RepID=UPI002DCEDBAA|nr:acetyl-CoA acetyltransferase [Sphingobium sp. HWE2-09]
MTGSIIGWAHTAFGKHEQETLETLIITAALEAMRHAGIGPADVDQIFVGHFNSGFSRQDFAASLVLQASPDLRFKPATRVENACASGSAAIYQALNAIDAGRARHVLVVGAEKMTDARGEAVGKNLLGASYVQEEGAVRGGFAGLFGQIASQYFERHGDQSDALALIAAKNHRNGVNNPWAQLRKDLGYEFCRMESERNPLVAGPLKRTDCSPVSDGAAALVLASDDAARASVRAVTFKAASHVQDFLPMSLRDPTFLEGCTAAWDQAFRLSHTTLSDLSFVETHDCFTIAELLEYEAMGLAPHGQGSRVVKEGLTEMGGKLPVNPSGGLKAKGHPIGATGVSMHVLTAMQLCNEAPAGMQVAGATLGGVFNMGGTGVANYASILERIV